MNNKSPLDSEALIEVKNLSFNRGERVIYDDISLKIRRGQITAIMGPSGTGKTTLLRLIGGQLSPDQGEVLLDGKNIASMSRNELFAARARMGMLFQSGHCLPICQCMKMWHSRFVHIPNCQNTSSQNWWH